MKVFVGLSGGVDSAVTAALLKNEGHEVVGVFIKGDYPEGLPCTWAEDRRDAMRVAAHLSLPFATLDASKEYKKAVLDYLLTEYRAGRTPNPDVMCNRDVKFGAFYRYARNKGAEALATGHYARQEGGRLLRGADAGKDQSYFLWAVQKEALAFARFPLGGFRKEETRALAKRLALPVAAKKDSQGICFLGPVSVEEYLRSEFGTEKGAAHDPSGKEVGKHDGVLLSTIGERVALESAAPGPWYVIGKDIAENRLIVAHERPPMPKNGQLRLGSVNLLEDSGGILSAQYRYHGPIVQGAFDAARSTFVPDTALPEPVAEGQSLVLYDDEALIGGGIIAS